MIGRFLGAPLLRRFKPGYLLTVCAIFAGALVTASMMLGGHTAIARDLLSVHFVLRVERIETKQRTLRHSPEN